MDLLTSNPFGLLTFIAAPAILTNASSINALATSNRLARSVDRTRTISTAVAGREFDEDPSIKLQVRLLRYAEKRTLVLVRALTAFYLSVGAFAAASLISLLGALFFAANQQLLRDITLYSSLAAGVVGIGGLVVGSGFLVFETQITLKSLSEETAFRLSNRPVTPGS